MFGRYKRYIEPFLNLGKIARPVHVAQAADVVIVSRARALRARLAGLSRLKPMALCLAVAFIQLVSFEVAAGERLEAIATGMVSATAGSTQQLQTLAIYGSAVFVLLVLLNLVREKKGKKRLMALLAIQLLCNAMLIHYLA